ncbi:PREDICTED: uncharacterized protein LOC104823525 [Tarenaya hassleriana]|uniref:uncharacterized protein LOC104823525 n=1 Tax=Tarenaya hassleriana TaxID=28532 RepID=UPI00053C7783|nr:PREDICTED: uncharacterized protein LOC104823525 [Tarenaya hassleriana]XP_010553432.1 PREDICTED: uncharacterized protein LOC104823525 [Tarenaya hassleriana]
MASEAPSWADQWGAGGFGAMPEEENPNAKKDAAAGKNSGVAKSGINRAKIVAFIGVKWIKNLVHMKKKKKDSTS